MKKLAGLIVVAAVLAGLAGAQAQAPRPLPAEAPAGVRFIALDVFVDSGTRPLAAYQFEFTATGGDAKLVGVEQGAHPAFATPPYYDPAALSKGRVIVAAFSTAPNLPSGRTRVARLHLQVGAGAKPEYAVKLDVAGTVDGTEIAATADVAGAE